MRLFEIGTRVRAARQAHGLTQADLARAAGVSRVTLNQLENGTLKDLGFNKLAAILTEVGLRIVTTEFKVRRPDRIAMAATTASVGFRQPLSTQELLEALFTGKAPTGKRPHLRRLFEDSPSGFVRRLLEDLRHRSPPGRLAKGVEKLGHELQISRSRMNEWTAPD